jgi:hypothetical protein
MVIELTYTFYYYFTYVFTSFLDFLSLEIEWDVLNAYNPQAQFYIILIFKQEDNGNPFIC